MLQVGAGGPEGCAGAEQPLAQVVRFAVHVLLAAQICEVSVPVLSPAAFAQRESTRAFSLPPAIAEPMHVVHALVAPAGTIARPFLERQNVVLAVQAVTVVPRRPAAVHVTKLSLAVKGVPGTPTLLPEQTREFGMHSATHAAVLPAVWHVPIAQTAGAPHLPAALQVSVAALPGPPSASVQRIAPGLHSAPQSFALLPASEYVTHAPDDGQLVAVADHRPFTQVWNDVELFPAQRSSPAVHSAEQKPPPRPLSLQRPSAQGVPAPSVPVASHARKLSPSHVPAFETHAGSPQIALDGSLGLGRHVLPKPQAVIVPENVPSAAHATVFVPEHREVPATQAVAQVASVGGTLLVLLFPLVPGMQTASPGQTAETY